MSWMDARRTEGFVDKRGIIINGPTVVKRTARKKWTTYSKVRVTYHKDFAPVAVKRVHDHGVKTE